MSIARVWWLAALGLSFGSGCEHAKSGSQYLAEADSDVVEGARECGLLGEGEAHVLVPAWYSDLPKDVAVCLSACWRTSAERCPELEEILCVGTMNTPERLSSCTGRCREKEHLDCDHGKTRYESYQACDGVAQCSDRSDEHGCVWITGLCDDGERLELGPIAASEWVVCDGRADCRDGSDEHDCQEELYCADGTRFYEYQRCDGEQFCEKGEDEHDCPDREWFECKDGSRKLPLTSLCDLAADCADGSDESVAQGCAQLSCPIRPFECFDGTLLASERRCDGQEDCGRGEDERVCEVDLERRSQRLPRPQRLSGRATGFVLSP